MDPIVTYIAKCAQVSVINGNGNGASYGKASTARKKVGPGTVYMPFMYACDMYVLLHKG